MSKKRNKKNDRILIIIGIIVAIMIIMLILILNLIKPKNQEVQTTNLEENTVIEDISVEEEVMKMNESDRIKRYIGIFFEDIENEDYQKAYDVLNEDFRNTYFPNIEEFTTYVQKYFSSSNLGITYDNIERLGNNKTGNMYVVWIYIRNLLDLYKTDEQRETEETNYINFVILEHDYNNYEMSFSVVNIEE